MIKIVAVSDNHGDLDGIKQILNDNPNADYYFHLGDNCQDSSLIKPFCSIRGNNDYDINLPDYRVIDIGENNKVFLIHGHQFSFNMNGLVKEAKNRGCNIIIFGHTHLFHNSIIDGVHIINPGSCFYNRDMSPCCYAKITINNNDISVERVNLSI